MKEVGITNTIFEIINKVTSSPCTEFVVPFCEGLTRILQ